MAVYKVSFEIRVSSSSDHLKGTNMDEVRSQIVSGEINKAIRTYYKDKCDIGNMKVKQVK